MVVDAEKRSDDALIPRAVDRKGRLDLNHSAHKTLSSAHDIIRMSQTAIIRHIAKRIYSTRIPWLYII